MMKYLFVLYQDHMDICSDCIRALVVICDVILCGRRINLVWYSILQLIYLMITIDNQADFIDTDISVHIIVTKSIARNIYEKRALQSYDTKLNVSVAFL
mmetsp:Transcript_465/g.548  ORF Transcript_465/g.548 Transcript_465/m.548 type:complete len:99 (-) Transcript_465:700-996(-)